MRTFHSRQARNPVQLATSAPSSPYKSPARDTPDSFIATWHANTRNEAAAAKAHFLDLCALLGVPPPQSDPTGATYAFEKDVTKASGAGGWADVWKRGCFGWEYKSRGGDLEKAHDRLATTIGGGYSGSTCSESAP